LAREEAIDGSMLVGSEFAKRYDAYVLSRQRIDRNVAWNRI
jgi:hypothetical protein